MKTRINFICIAILSVLLVSPAFQSIYAQDKKVKKSKVRLKASYLKIMDGEVLLDFSASSKINRKNVKVKNIELTVYNTTDNAKIILGKVKTNANGKATFSVKGGIKSLVADSTGTYTIGASFKGNDHFKKAKKSIRFKDATILAKLVTKDSLYYISATFKVGDSVISGQDLTVQLDRLFRPLTIGDEFYHTDKNGTILVPIEVGLPGVDGILNLEVVLIDHDDYGNIKAIVNAPIGKAIVDESTFNDRTMWSPRNKTPIFLLIFPNLLIVGIWSLIIYLFINLFKISKN